MGRAGGDERAPAGAFRRRREGRRLDLRLWAAGLLLVGIALAVTACDNGGSQEPEATGVSAASASPSSEPEPTETAAAETAVPDGGISEVDFSQVAAVKALLQDSGGRLVAQQIIFADLTGDGVDEAVVPISSGGTGGTIAYAVFGYRGGDLKELLEVKPAAGRVTVAVQDGVLVDTEPLYAPEDPLCCPSQLHHTFYRWNGSKLVVDHEETETAPSAKP